MNIHYNTSLLPLVLFAIGILAPMEGISQEKSTGLVFSKEEDYRTIPLATTPMMGTLPPSRDLTKWFPAPGDQGTQSSCVAWAVGYGLKSFQETIERKGRNSSNWRFSPAFIYNQIKIADCQSGANIETALKFLRKEGCALLTDFPYDPTSCQQIPGTQVKGKARPFIIADYRRVDAKNHAEVKSQLNSSFPVVIGMMIDEGFQALRRGEIYNRRSGRELGGHAMIVIGYDDSVGGGAYKVLNSWGTNWGDGGYGWISYDAFSRLVREAYTAQDVVVNDPRDEPDPVIPPRPDDPRPNPVDVFPRPLVNADAAANLGAPQVLHNQPVQTPIGIFPGMLITVPGNITSARGAMAQLLVRFYFPDGRPLLANRQELNFRDINGLVAVGTPSMPVLNDPANTNKFTLGIPYYALNFQLTGGRNVYPIRAIATIYVNQFEKAKSIAAPMQVRY